jgi:dolichyl-phosphate beta-glucosyltransferase
MQCPRDQYGNLVRSPFDTIFKDPVVHLSVIIPVYNEQLRISEMLKNTITYLHKRYTADKNFTSEIIVVDDGSQDDTVPLVLQYSQKYTSEFIRLLKLPTNTGKGSAVQMAALHSRGRFVLMIDVDCYDDLESLELLEDALSKGVIPAKGSQFDQINPQQSQQPLVGMAIGCRVQQSNNNIDKSTKILPQLTRNGVFGRYLRAGIDYFIHNYNGFEQIKDTQCGFKLFTRETCKYLFLNQKIFRWCFDIELLTIATLFKIPIIQVQIELKHNNGNKIDLNACRDLILIRLLYSIGFWKLTSPQLHTSYAIPYASRIGTIPM